MHSQGFNQVVRWTSGAVRKARRLSRFLACRIFPSRGMQDALRLVRSVLGVHGEGGPVMRPTASEPWVPAPPSQPSESRMKRAPLSFKDSHRTRKGALRSPGANGSPATLPHQRTDGNRHPAVCFGTTRKTPWKDCLCGI